MPQRRGAQHADSGGHQGPWTTRSPHTPPSPGLPECEFQGMLWHLFPSGLLCCFGGEFVLLLPNPPDLNPNDTEAIISAFLTNATESGMDGTVVDDLLEEIFRQVQVSWGGTTSKHPRRGSFVFATSTLAWAQFSHPHSHSESEEEEDREIDPVVEWVNPRQRKAPLQSPQRKNPHLSLILARGKQSRGSAWWTSMGTGPSGTSTRRSSPKRRKTGVRKQPKRTETVSRMGG